MLRVESTFFLLVFFFSLSILATVYVWVLSKWEYECSGVLTTIYFEFENVIEFLEYWKNSAVYQVLRWPLPGSWTASQSVMQQLYCSGIFWKLLTSFVKSTVHVCTEWLLWPLVKMRTHECPYKRESTSKPVSLVSLGIERSLFVVVQSILHQKSLCFQTPQSQEVADRRWTSLVHSYNSGFRFFKTQESHFSLIGLVNCPMTLTASTKFFPGIMVHNYIDFWSFYMAFCYWEINFELHVCDLLNNTR